MKNDEHNGPYLVELESGKLYSWCACGLSKKQPFWDGAHKGTDMRSHKYLAAQTGKKLFCGCRRTKNPPFCDGSHSK